MRNASRHSMLLGLISPDYSVSVSIGCRSLTMGGQYIYNNSGDRGELVVLSR